MNRIITWILGGRPMIHRQYRFNDIMTGAPIYRWQDQYGRRWLAETAWSAFRVRIPDDME